MTEKYKPIIDPNYDFRTSCSLEEAVDYLMGRTQNTVLRKNLIPDDAHPDEIELYVFSWQTILPLEREAAETAYENAKVENENEEIINAKLANLQHCDTQINKAHQYLCEINDELNKGKDSELRIDQFSTTNPKHPQITISSLASWAKEKYGLSIFKPETDKNATTDNKKASTTQLKTISPTLYENTLITLALFIDLTTKNKTKFIRTDGQINKSALSDAIIEHTDKNGYDTFKQSKSTLISKISEAIDIMKEKLPTKP